MSEQALVELDEQLNCAICLDTYTDPKLLQCFHVYCKKCLIKLVVRDQPGQLILTCPTCRKVTPIPENGVSGLQSAFRINRLLEIRDMFEKSEGLMGVETTDNTSEERVILQCSEHTDKELEVYCETCEKVICLKCVLKGGQYQGHDSVTLDAAFGKYQGEITSSLEPIEKQLTTINSALTQLHTRCEEISNQRVAIEDSIHNTFRRLHEILDIRKRELISELHQMTQGKLKSLATQRDQIETTQAQLSGCLNFLKESLRKGCPAEVLMMRKEIKELAANNCQVDSMKPSIKADIAFSASSDISTLCQNYGKLTLAPDPSKCYIKNMREVVIVREKTTVLLQAFDSRNQSCEVPIKLLDCELVSEIRGIIVKGSVERRGENHYKISYRPTMKGRHQLHVKIDGHHIRGSPFTLAVAAPVKKIGTPIQAVLIESPEGVGIHQNGEIIATSRARHCVSVFGQSGKKLQSFGAYGSALGQFDCPSDVTVDGEGNILVADTDNHRIQKFTVDGHFLAAVGTEGSGPLQFICPWGITFNATNSKVYVVDKDNHRIQVLNSDLTFSNTYGKSGSNKGQFYHPCGIACDSTGNVYVADFENHRIQVFTAEGEFLRMFGVADDQGRGEIYFPVGVAVDTSDKVYVSELFNHCVTVFTSEGQFWTLFGQEGRQSGEFRCPCGLAVDSSGVVYVCDSSNKRIQFF